VTVLYLSNCPPALRGDLTKWLMEIATGVYVGRVSARVRDKLWDRVVETCAGGRAVLVFAANNEQRMDFRVHGETWEPIDFDGLKLMLRPSPARLSTKQAKSTGSKKPGFSNAARYQKAKAFAWTRSKRERVSEPNDVPLDGVISVPKTHTESSVVATKSRRSAYRNFESYVVVDIETTGLKPLEAEITEIGAIRVVNQQVVDVYQSLVSIAVPVPAVITELTGITDEMLAKQGKPLDEVLEGLVDFLGGMPIIAHNAPFEVSFLDVAFDRCGLGRLTNPVEDTLAIARSVCKGLDSYKLQALTVCLELDLAQLELQGYRPHRSLGDCCLTHLLFQKLMNFDRAGL